MALYIPCITAAPKQVGYVLQNKIGEFIHHLCQHVERYKKIGSRKRRHEMCLESDASIKIQRKIEERTGGRPQLIISALWYGRDDRFL